ncbi:polysaccharide deacetylase family protein [Pelagibius litoralis]|uniref:Chitooligosaccharide deacetylase n=1 Tax=Pelagibius litoralis TaxID=374515 RepID=A0A967KFL2_9PROT|nr:polysaccharide deacetylase family protein [Pelagibius litoralis]NIA72539.1 polysaccharide deacetylase family protein [Pelagibius litoralis]
MVAEVVANKGAGSGTDRSASRKSLSAATRRRILTVALSAALGFQGLTPSGAARAQEATPLQSAAQSVATGGAVILMYHRFGEDSLPSTNVRLAQFEAHLDELAGGGYKVLPLSEIVDALEQGRALPDRALAITIDDGALSVYTEAWPRLRARNLPFTVFISSEPLDRGLPGYLSWDQLREMIAGGGVSVGNHGHRHDHMARLTPKEQRANIDKAAIRLFAELGAAPEIFAYPYGEISAELRTTVQAAGFSAAFGQHSGAIGGLTDRLSLPRFPINEAYGDMDRFRLVANTLPLPVREVTPSDPFLRSVAQNPPSFGFTVAGPIEDLNNLNCFAKDGEPVLTRFDNRVELRLAGPLPAGRARINCTLRADDGRWRWFGTQFVVTDQAAP